MGLLSKLFGTPAKAQRAITYQIGTNTGLIETPTYAGVAPSESVALGLSALWCGIRTISQDVGTLEPVLYREKAGGTRDVEENHPLADLLEDPNPEMSRVVLWETLTAHLVLYGNFYAEVERDGAGRPVALWPIHPRNVAVMRDDGGRLVYRVTVAITNLDPDHTPGQTVYLNQEDVLHVPGLCLSGSGVGESLLKVARETIAFGAALTRAGSSFFANAARPAGVLQTAGQLSEAARENLRRSWQSMHGGSANTGKTAILEEGIAWQPINLSTNEQNQYKDVLTFYVTEVARLLVIPPHLLMDLADAKWSNITEQNRDYLNRTLRPILERIEAEVERKLLSPPDRKRLYVEFDTSTLLRADMLSRYQAYQIGITAGFLTADECRAEENLPPLTPEQKLDRQPAPAPQLPADQGEPDDATEEDA